MKFYDLLSKLSPGERITYVSIIAFVVIMLALLLWGSPDYSQGMVG